MNIQKIQRDNRKRVGADNSTTIDGHRICINSLKTSSKEESGDNEKIKVEAIPQLQQFGRFFEATQKKKKTKKQHKITLPLPLLLSLKRHQKVPPGDQAA